MPWRGLGVNFLPDPVRGEIPLTQVQSSMLRDLFQDCGKRLFYFMLSAPPFATAEKPLFLLAPKMAAEVAGEFADGDAYELKSHQQKGSEMKVILDIGANIGLFSIVACNLFPQARIFAFEPHPANYRLLVNNLVAAGCEKHVTAYHAGVTLLSWR